MSAEPVPHQVLAWRDGPGRADLAPLWDRVLQLGWLPLDTTRIVLQIGECGRSQTVLETARALVAAISEHLPAASLEIVDPAACEDDWDARLRHHIRNDGTVCLTGIGASVLTVPRLWFGSYFLITLAGVCPKHSVRLANVLHAQADPLRALQNRYDPSTLACEAHRLAPSDLVVACGKALWGEEDSERWWVASPSDVGVELAVAQAARIEPKRLPLLHALARHELLIPVVALDGVLPHLRGHATSRWSTRLAATHAAVFAALNSVRRDAGAARYNFRRLPHAVRRRLAARRGRAS
jgi:hypothetical protein